MQETFNNIVYRHNNGIEYVQFKRLLEYPEITHCYTLRSNHTLNFPPINKDEKMLKQSYQKICECLGLDANKVMKPHQTHTDNIEVVKQVEVLEDVDGMVTNQKGLVLLTTSADCTSLLFYDPVKKVIGDTHSGWRGTLQAIGRKTVEKMMEEYGCQPEDIICCICPCIKQCCFEVEDDVKSMFEKEYAHLKDMDKIIQTGKVVEGKQKYYIDTTEINKQLLKQIGLKEENIIDCGICTVCHSDEFHSYRVDKEKSGRNAAIISVRKRNVPNLTRKGEKMIPDKLKKGDTIGLIAPSSPVEKDDLEVINKSILLMESAGFTVRFSKNALTNTLGYGASAKEKAQDINDMFEDEEVKAIFCISGGFNSNTTFDYLDYDRIKLHPKIICGFSDSTSLLNVIYSKTGLVTFHGPTFKALTSWPTQYGYEEVIKRLIEGGLLLGKVEDEYTTIQEGKTKGILVGGNLSLVNEMVAGKYSIDFTDKILFLEELFLETPPELASNYLYHMKQNGVFDKIKGIWLGNYDGSISLERILLDTLEGEYKFPIIKSNNFGHIDKKTVIPIGTMAKIDTEQKIKIELVENCVK